MKKNLLLITVLLINAVTIYAQNATTPITAVSFPKNVIDKNGGAIDFYAKLTGFSGSISVGGCEPHFFIQRDDLKNGVYLSNWYMGFNSNNGAGNGGLVGHGGRAEAFYRDYNCGTGWFDDWTYEEALGAGQVDQWHHYRIVWDKDGVTDNDPLKRMSIYVDGVLNTQVWNEEPLHDSVSDVTGGVLNLISTGNPGCGTLSGMIAIDEFKVYDRKGNLVLYNSLGSANEVTHSVVGPNGAFNGGGNAHFIKGIVGNAVEANPVSGFGTSAPTITSFFPASGPISSTVTINGTNFSTNPLDNIVYFGAVRAVVASATATTLKVYAPVGTTYQSISVTVNGLTAYTAKPFVVTFEGGNNAFTKNSFAPKKDIPLGYNPCGTYIADFDGDGRTDIVTGDFNSSAISVLRNTSHSGSVLFAQKKNFIAGNGNRHCTAGDIDGDGKPDIVTANIYANTISVLRNVSTKGNIAFASKIDFAAGNSPGYAVIRDLDGDGKPEIIVTNFVSTTFSVFRNTSSPGNISFDARKDFTTAAGNFNCAVSDLDGDGKPDIVVGTEAPSNIFSIFRNTSTPGNISFASRLDYTTYAERQGVAIGDLDGDGKPDIAIENFNNPDQALSIFRNTSTKGAISLAPKIDYSSGGTADFACITDLNGDGKADIILNNYWSDNISVFKNIGSSGVISFASKVDYTTGSGPRFINAGDIDGDGKPDIVLDNLFSETVTVLRSLIGDNGCTPPSNLNVANITSSSARLTWTSSDTITKTFEIRYRAAGDSAWIHKRRDGTQTAITLQNLLPNTTYQWQVRSNCGGEITQGVQGPAFTTTAAFASGELSDAAINSGKIKITISPNPVTSNLLNLHVMNAIANNCQLSIADIQGRILITQNLLLSNGSLNKSIDVSALPKGVYILKVINNKNEQQQIKFVKEN